MKNKVTKALITIVISFIFLMGISPSGLPNTNSGNNPLSNMGDQKWERLGPADFPARVKAVVFKKNVLDANHSVGWGQWAVSFDTESPVAKWVTCVGDDCYGGFNISKLVCTNSIIGRESCSLYFSIDRRRGSDCYLMIKGEPDILQRITCPVDVQFEK